MTIKLPIVDDDRAALQNSITYAETFARPPSVFIPARDNTRVVTSMVNLASTKKNSIRGDARRASVIEYQGTTSSIPVLKATASGSLTTDLDFARLEITKTGVSTNITGLQLGDSGGSGDEFLMVDVDQVLFNGLDKGFVVYGGDEINITRSWAFDVTNGFEFQEVSSNVNMIGNHFMGVSGTAANNAGGSSRHLVLGNTVQGTLSGMKGFVYDYFDTLAVISNYYESQHASATGPFVHLGPTGIGTANMSGALVLGNHVNAANAAGLVAIKVDHAKAAIVGGNSFTGLGTGIQITSSAVNTLILPERVGG